jgi:hypothetical protein
MVRIADGQELLITSSPAASPSSSTPLSSTIAGTTPRKGSEAAPGLAAHAPGSGAIMWPPVSVCHQVSTTGQRPPPTTSWYLWGWWVVGGGWFRVEWAV